MAVDDFGFYTRESGSLVYHALPLVDGSSPLAPIPGQVPTWDPTLQRYVPTSLGVGAFADVGNTPGSVAAGNDPRLSDQRTPLDGSVTTAKIVDLNVTTNKLADSGVTNVKLASSAVTDVKVAVAAGISLDKTADSATRVAFLPAERTKLTGVATGATANSTDAFLLARTNHTGVTPVAGIGTGTPAAGRYVDGGTGVWTALPAPQVRVAKTISANYTVIAADVGANIEVNSASAVVVTVPASVLPTGGEIRFIRTGVGTLTFTAGAGATVNTPSVLTARAQYSSVDIIARSATAFVIDGDLG